MGKFARIEFHPICSNCGEKLPLPIDYTVLQYPDRPDRHMCIREDFTITPSQCEKCGAIFDSIATIGAFPFYGYPERGEEQ